MEEDDTLASIQGYEQICRESTKLADGSENAIWAPKSWVVTNTAALLFYNF